MWDESREWPQLESKVAGSVTSPEAFLSGNPQLVALVEEAVVRLRTTFGRSARIGMRMLDNPEEVATPELVVVAETLLDPDAAMAAMERLENEWWFDQLARSEGRVHLAFQHTT